MPLICHLTAWKLDKTNFGFADRNKAKLQELVPQPEPKKQKVEMPSQRTTRSQRQEETAKQENQRKQEEEEAIATWQRISKEHHREKEAE